MLGIRRWIGRFRLGGLLRVGPVEGAEIGGVSHCCKLATNARRRVKLVEDGVMSQRTSAGCGACGLLVERVCSSLRLCVWTIGRGIVCKSTRPRGRLACFTPRQRLDSLRQRRIVVVVITHQAGGWQQRLNSVSESGLEGQVIVWW
jgi:hypothetical protein